MFCVLLCFLEAVGTTAFITWLPPLSRLNSLSATSSIRTIKPVHTDVSLRECSEIASSFGKKINRRWPVDFRPQRYLAPYPSQNKTAVCHKPCASGKSSVTFILKWSLREECGVYMFGCGADVHNWRLQSCSWLRPGRDPSLYSWASGSHPVSSLALWNCCQRTWRRFNRRWKALVMEQIEPWGLCLGGLPCKAMSGGECRGYEVVHFLWYKIPVENQGSTSLSSFLFFSKIQGVRITCSLYFNSEYPWKLVYLQCFVVFGCLEWPEF